METIVHSHLAHAHHSRRRLGRRSVTEDHPGHHAPSRARGHRPRLRGLRPALWISGTLLALVLLAVPPAAWSQECADCHDNVPLTGNIHEPFGCTGCHSDIAEFPHPEERMVGDLMCSQCHEAGASLEGSVHAGVVECQSCHGSAHEIRAVSEVGSPSHPLQQPTTCGGCHGEDLSDAFQRSVHGRALLGAGLAGAPSCAGCHGAHEILPPTDPQAATSREGLPEMCGSCHTYLLDTWETQSAHGLAWAAGDPEAPVCNTCHSSHQVTEVHTAEQRLAWPDQCGDCHLQRFNTYRDGFHGQVTDLGFVAAANCADCHTPHANLPASDPRSSIHPDNIAATCGACHGEVGAGFLSYDPHPEPDNPQDNKPVYWVWLAMTSLLLGVFGFFGLHDLLWFQRSVVGWLRGELPAGGHRYVLTATAPDDGPWVRRFRPVHIVVHLTVVVTFLVLAATGLPLKFHDTGWAHVLTAVPSGVWLARYAHRVAAVLTFAYALVHLGFVLRRVLRQKDRGILWGWRSMVPRPQDLWDLWDHVRYFLYLRPRPRFDRWTYWEKFDYFAVFWGIPVIGISGLMLWFPGFFTRFLPGWTLNAAHVVHSDEALLATGFIFIFHFFHSHLRPEAFPMDPVMFTGSMPLERFREERPKEYERLVERGELEQHLVDPPTESRLRFARWFGFSALLFGLFMAFAILYSVAVHGLH